MTEQPDDTPRRVVKKVVKKTVVRPVGTPPVRGAGPASGRPASAPPRQSPTRLATPARAARAARAAAPTVEAPTVEAPTVEAPAARAIPTLAPVPAPTATLPASSGTRPVKPARPRRLTLPSFSLPRPHVGGAVLAVRHRIEDAWDWLASTRLPHLEPVPGSAVTGIVVGLLSVVIGWGFYEIFSATLGTQAGGGWGVLAFVFLSFVAFVVGELLLAGFGVPHARVVSILSVLLVLLVVLLFFLELAAGVWAWLLIPILCVLAFIASSSVMAAAAKEQNPQRLPWEPVDESQVKRN